VVGRQNADIADTLHLRDVAVATTFWLSMGYNVGCMYGGFLYMGCHLANTTEPSMCGGDAALCQITLTTC